MLDIRLIKMLREAYGDGRYGGWKRDHDVGALFEAWLWRGGQVRVVLERAARGDQTWTTLRIFEKDWTTLADCKIHNITVLLNVLHAYHLIGHRHTNAYGHGQWDMIYAMQQEAYRC